MSGISDETIAVIRRVLFGPAAPRISGERISPETIVVLRRVLFGIAA